MEVIAIILFIFLTLLAIFKPFVGLCTFFVISYIRPQDYMPVLAVTEPAKWLLIITFISFIFSKLHASGGFAKAKQNYGIIGIFIFILLSRIVAVDGVRWWLATQDFIRVCLVYFMFINLVNTEKRLKKIFVIFLFVNLFVALRFYLAYRFGDATYWGSKPGDSSLGFMANADDLGIGLVIALSLPLMLILHTKNFFIKCAGVLMSGCFMLGVLATQSRGALLGVFAVYIGAILTRTKPSRLKKTQYTVGMMILLVLFAGFVFKYRYTLDDSFNSIQEEDDTGKLGRMATWTAARNMIKEHPLTGVGRGNFVSYWASNYGEGIYGYQVAHNIIYEVAAEIGIFGLIAFLYFALYGLADLRRIKKKYGTELVKHDFLDMIFAVYVVGLIGFLVNGMFITVAFYWHIYILVALFVSAKNIFLKKMANDAGGDSLVVR